MRRIRPLTLLLLTGLALLAGSLALSPARGDPPPQGQPPSAPADPADRGSSPSTLTDARRIDEGRPARSGAELVAELGCGACHTGLAPAPAVPAPALDHAGLRYSPGYLFDYLKSPRQVRLHIGAARMPDFRLDERESLALALYLSTLRPDTARSRWPSSLRLPRRGVAPDDTDRLMAGELGCTSCHSLAGRGAGAAPDLATIGARLRPEWVPAYLRNPASWDPGTAMPSTFYDHAAGEDPRERVPGAEAKLRAVARRVSDLGAAGRESWAKELARARAAYPVIDAASGRRIFVAQNCAGCHTRSPGPAWANAPDLRLERSRVRSDWLRSFLREPRAIRPFGHYPGSGSRMPDFRLSGEEADSITAHLMQLGGAAPGLSSTDAGAAAAATQGSDGGDGDTPRQIPPYAARNAEALLRDRLPCLGCHSLDGEGGRVGPDLTGAGLRLRPEWIRAIVLDPSHAAPGTSMPATPMPDATRELLISYLQSRVGSSPATDLSLLDHPVHFPRGASTARGLYGRYCAACHGSGGGGDGFNARYLPTTPTAHADANGMAARPDDSLFDAIHAGGLVMGGSARMPAFGGTLTADQIRLLVAYLRELCDCLPPAWSADGTSGSRESPS